MILKASLLLAFAAFLISLGVSFQALGLDQGMVIHERLMEEHRIENGEEILSFSAEGPRTYEYFSNRYGNLTFLFVLFILAQFIETTFGHKLMGLKVISRIMSFGSLLAILYLLRIVLRDMSYVEPYIWSALQNSVAKSWLNYPWLLLFIALALFCFQLITLVPWFRSEKISVVSSASR